MCSCYLVGRDQACSQKSENEQGNHLQQRIFSLQYQHWKVTVMQWILTFSIFWIYLYYMMEHFLKFLIWPSILVSSASISKVLYGEVAWSMQLWRLYSTCSYPIARHEEKGYSSYEMCPPLQIIYSDLNSTRYKLVLYYRVGTIPLKWLSSSLSRYRILKTNDVLCTLCTLSKAR